MLVEDCTITGNFARDQGGGIFCTVASKGRFERVALWGNCSGQEGAQIAVESGASATFACSVVDSSGVYSVGVIEFAEDNLLHAAPGFCDPDTCTAAPSTMGDYGVGDESPCLARNSPCGARIGGIGPGACASTYPVVETSWGKLKDIFGPPGATRK
jgi:predicted outer membrane repeat protein